MKRWMVVVSLVAGAGCASPDCKQACETVQKCGFSTNGLDCESNCKNSFSDHSCAGCIEGNAKDCQAIKNGCPSSCGGHQF